MPIRNKSRTPGVNADDTAARDQRILLNKVWARDGYQCLLTDKVDEAAPLPIILDLLNIDAGEFAEYLECAHIIPFSLNGKSATLDLITRWTGGKLAGPELLGGSQVNGPWNAMLMDPAAHKDYDKHRWGIEALQNHDGSYTYRSVWVADNDFPRFRFTSRQLWFGRKQQFQDEPISLPHPLLCNLHLAVARILHMSGAGEVIDAVLRDMDDLFMRGAQLGGKNEAVAWFLLEGRLSYISAAQERGEVGQRLVGLPPIAPQFTK